MEIKKVSVIGAGTMGHGIAQVCAQAGLEVNLQDLKDEFVKGGLARIKRFLQDSVERQKMSQGEAEAVLAKIRGTTNLLEAVGDADLIIEAIIEDLNLKKEFFQRVASICKKETILASNTSTLSITEIASAIDRPEKVVGMHFFNPVQLMKPIEIIRGMLTSNETLENVKSLTLRLDKIPIVVKDSPGFASSRLGLALFVEASRMLEEGIASVKDIDMGAKLFYSHKMGPFETCDLVGLDARLNNLKALYQATGDPKWSPPLLLKQLVASGYLGKKPSGKGGYYAYFGLENNIDKNE